MPTDRTKVGEDSLRNKSVTGVRWSIVDGLAGSGVVFLVNLILARILSSDEFGLIGIIAIFIAVFNSIVDSGFSSALIRKKNAANIDYSTTFFFNLVLSILLFVALVYAAPFIADFFGRAELTSLTRAMAVIVVINGFAIVQRTLLVKQVDFKTQSKVSLIASITGGILGIAMALTGYGVWSLVAQQLSRQFLNTVFLWVFCKWRPAWEFSVQSFREMFGFGWKLLLSGLIDTLWKQMYQVVIGKVYKPNTLGQYTRAIGFTELFSHNLTAVVQRVSFPVLSAIQDEKERLKYAYRKVIKLTMFAAFLLMLGLAAVAKPMVCVVIGEKWLPAAEMMQIICFSAVLYPLHAINLNMLQVQGRSDIFLYLEIAKKSINIIPILLGVFCGIKPMLLATVLMGLISYVLNSHYSGKFLRYNMWAQVRDILPSFLFAIGVALPTWSISLLALPMQILFLLQMGMGVGLTLVLGKITRLNEYIELKEIIITSLNKVLRERR